MPLSVTVNTIAKCLRTDCNILGDNKKNLSDNYRMSRHTATQSRVWDTY